MKKKEKEEKENEENIENNIFYITNLKLKNVQIYELNIDKLFPFLTDLKISEQLIKIDIKNSTLNIKRLSFEKLNLQNYECNEIISMDISPDKKYCYLWIKDNYIIVIKDFYVDTNEDGKKKLEKIEKEKEKEK